jgi:hypothetical protein
MSKKRIEEMREIPCEPARRIRLQAAGYQPYFQYRFDHVFETASASPKYPTLSCDKEVGL